MRNNKIIRNLTIILAVLSVFLIATYLTFSLIGIFNNNYGINILFAILVPTVLVILSLLLAEYRSQIVTIRQLENENTYNLGSPNHFYNSYFFEKKVNKLLKKRAYRNLDARIIAFTFSNNIVSKGASRNEFVVSFLGLISKYLTVEFGPSNHNSKLPYSFCYYHGVFLFFMFGNNHEIESTINRIENALYEIAKTNQFNIYVQPFFGIASINREKINLIETIDHSIYARDRAEKRYETSYFYDDSSSNNITNDLDEIRNAIDENEFVVYYQPKFYLKTKQFISTEALVRWNSKKYGLLPPSKFIEIAEISGLIHQIDNYVLEQVCKDIHENKLKGRRNLPVSVNFSMQEFYDNKFIEEVLMICQKYNVPTSMIQIEVTESTSQINKFMSTSIINKLKNLGFRILMDDFGTGFSNIENLMLLPFDAVKLDRSYIERIVNDSKAFELVKLLILFCKNNKLEVIAEGVDDQEQIDVLSKLGCDTIQGFYYSKPIPKDELDKFILPNGNKFEKIRKE